jgi:hypothetical protein
MVGPSLFVISVTLLYPCALAAPADYAAIAAPATIHNWLIFDQGRIQSLCLNRIFQNIKDP